MKTLTGFNLIADLGKVAISYTDNLGKSKTVLANVEDIFANDLTEEVTTYLASNSNVPLSTAMVKDIKVEGGTFAISGDVLPLKLQVISDLNTKFKATYDAFDNFINSYTGSPIVSLASTLGTGKVVINGVTYDSTTTPSYETLYSASNGTMKEATLMGIKIFNNL
ncbi:MAG: hypothetical protein HYR91_11090 [Flavobacteriia bacterium]|nr:hypothetical protein [Flavobacteriia bacterium]